MEYFRYAFPNVGRLDFHFVRGTPSKSRECARARNATPLSWGQCRTERQRRNPPHTKVRVQDLPPSSSGQEGIAVGCPRCIDRPAFSPVTCVASIFGILYFVFVRYEHPCHGDNVELGGSASEDTTQHRTPHTNTYTHPHSTPLPPTALRACCGFDLCYKYIWYLVFGISSAPAVTPVQSARRATTQASGAQTAKTTSQSLK